MIDEENRIQDEKDLTSFADKYFDGKKPRERAKAEAEFIESMYKKGFKTEQVKAFLDDYKKNNNVNKTKETDVMNKVTNSDKVILNNIINNASNKNTNHKGWTIDKAFSKQLDILQKKYGLTDAERKDLALNIKKGYRNSQTEEQANRGKEFAESNPVLGTLASYGYKALQPLEGVANSVTGFVTGDDRYLDNSILENVNARREGASANMSNGGKAVYNALTGIGDLGLSIAESALLGTAPASLLALNTADRVQNEAIERGANTRDASAFGIGAGILDYYFNTKGFDAIKERAVKDVAKNIPTFLKNTTIAGGVEGLENTAQDLAENALDMLVNGKDANLVSAYTSKIESGMSEEDALKSTLLDYSINLAGQFGMGAALGAGFGAVKNGNSLRQVGLEKKAAADELFRFKHARQMGILEEFNNEKNRVKNPNAYKTQVADRLRAENPELLGRLSDEDVYNYYLNRIDEDEDNFAYNTLFNVLNNTDNTQEIPSLKPTGVEESNGLDLMSNETDAQLTINDINEFRANNPELTRNMSDRDIINYLNVKDTVPESVNAPMVDDSAQLSDRRVELDEQINRVREMLDSTDNADEKTVLTMALNDLEEQARTIDSTIDDGVRNSVPESNDNITQPTYNIPQRVEDITRPQPVEEVVDMPTEDVADVSAKTVDNSPRVEPISQPNEVPADIEELGDATTDNLRERNTSKNIREGREDFSEDIQEEYRKNRDLYRRASNKIADEKSDEIMSRGIDYARNSLDYLMMRRSPVAIPLARKLANAYANNNDINSALAVSKQLAEANSESGAFIQANIINMFKDNPMGVRNAIEEELDSLNESGRNQFGKKWKDISLTEDEINAFNEATKLSGDEYTNAMKTILDGIGDRIEKNAPTSLKKKIVEAGHIGMLLNMATMKRNIDANIFMIPQRKLAQKFTAVGQLAYSIMNKDFKRDEALWITNRSRKIARKIYAQNKEALQESSKYFDDRLSKEFGTNSFKQSVSQRAYFKLHNDNALSRAWDSAKTKVGLDANKNIIAGVTDAIPVLNKVNKVPKKALNTLGKFITNGNEVFDNWDKSASLRDNLGTVRNNLANMEGTFDNLSAEKSIMENVRQFTYDLLDLGDEPFVKLNFVDRLASYMDAQGIKNIEDVPEEAIQIAKMAALKATFKDDNEFTRVFGKLAKIPVVGEAAIPFKKTTANLAARSYDYSLANTLYTAVQEGGKGKDADMHKVINAIGEGLSGTSMTALGILLYKNGVITGKSSSDKDQKDFDESNGKKPYAISTKGMSDFIKKYTGKDIDLGNTYKTWDWAQPWATDFVTGIAVTDAIDNDEDKSLYDIGTDVIAAYGDGILESDIMSSIKEMLGAGDFSDESTTMNVINSLVEFPTRYVPAQLKAVAKIRDNTKRETYVKGDTLATIGNTIKSGIPYLREQLPASYNAYGDEVKLAGDTVWDRTKAQMLSSGKTGIDQSKWYSKEIQKIYDTTENPNAFLRVAPRSIEYKSKDGKTVKVDLDNTKHSSFANKTGKMQDQLASAYFKSDLYNSAKPSAEDAEVMNSISKFAQAVAVNDMFEDSRLSKDNAKAKGILDSDGVDGLIKYFREEADNSELTKKLNDIGVTSNDVTKELYKSGKMDELEKYGDAEDIAYESFGRYGITKDQWNTYKTKGERLFKKELEYEQAAKDYGVTDTDEFRKAYNRSPGMAKSYAEAYKAITSTPCGKDKNGETKYLTYSKTTREIYDREKERGLKKYAEASAELESLGMDKKDTFTQIKHDNISFAMSHDKKELEVLNAVERAGSSQTEWIPELNSYRGKVSDDTLYDILLVLAGGSLDKEGSKMNKSDALDYYGTTKLNDSLKRKK